MVCFAFFNDFYDFREGPRLVALLKEMKEGLDLVRSKVKVLTQKVYVY